jgi:tRNA threonylcarbamoyladenosine biosynthesis protein TsaB
MLLAVDTSTAQMGLALFDGVNIPGEMTWHSQAHHTEQLAPALEMLLQKAGLSMEAIKVIGVAKGPGSFTSLRVGLAFTKGLALARHIPLVGVPTLDVVAAAMPLSERKLAALVQAGRGRLAVGWYTAGETGWKAEGGVEIMTAAGLEESIHKPVIICGELSAEQRHVLARRYVNVLLASPAQCVRRPAILAEIAWREWKEGREEPLASLAPLYLHTPGGPPA